MAQIDFKKIIEKVNYGSNPFAFFLKSGSDIIIPLDFQVSQNSIYNYISINEKIEETDAKEEQISSVDSTFGEFIQNVERFLGAPASFVNDYIRNSIAETPSQQSTQPNQTNLSGVIRLTRIPSTLANAELLQDIIFAIQFESQKEIQILESGIGKNFVWSKIAFKHFINGTESIRTGYCRTEDLVNKTENKKELITDFPGLLTEIIDKSTSDRLKPTSDFYNFSLADAEPDKIVFDKKTASYLILAPTSIENLNIIDIPEDITEPERLLREQDISNLLNNEFAKIFSQVVKKTMAFENRSETTSDNKNYEDKYYLFGKVEDYYISPRPIEPLYILVKIPLRNIYATSTPGIREIGSAIFGAVNSANSFVQGLDGKTAFDFSQKFPAIDSFLGAASNNAIANENLLDQIYNPSFSPNEYIDRENFKKAKNRSIAIRMNNFKEQFTTVADTLKKYKEEVDLERQKSEEQQKIIYNIDFFFYEKYFREFPDILDNFFMENGNFTLESVRKEIIYFIFNGSSVSDVGFINNPDYLVINGKDQLLQNLPFNDETFLFLLSNFEFIHKIDSSKESITDFLDKYIAPEELAYYQYVDSKSDDAIDKKSKDCLKSQKDLLKQQLKQNTNTFLADLKIGESKKNIEQTKEWLDITKNSKEATDKGELKKESEFSEWGKKFIDPKTVDWNVIIGELASCISDKEVRETAEWLTIALKDKLLKDQPLACSLPNFTIPKFPSIRLPPIPNIPSLLDNYLKRLENQSILAREQILISLLKGILDLFSLCEEADNALDIGKTNAEEPLIASNSQPLTGGSPEDNTFNDNNRQNQLKDANLINSNEDAETVSSEISLLLAEISKNLTKPEIISLYTATSSAKTIRITKLVISNLVNKKKELPNLRSKLGSTINNEYKPSDIKVIEFFAKFSKILKPEALTEQQDLQKKLANEPDILCKEPSEIDSNYAKKLSQKGLSDENAIAEAQRRRDDVKKKIANLVNSINLLDKDFLTPPPLNCVKNPDGTITPGISDSVEEPKELENIRNAHIESLYGPFDKQYNSDFKKWFSTAIQTKPNLDEDGDVTGSTVQFLGFYRDLFDKSVLLEQNNIFSITSNPISITEENEKTSKYAFLSPLDSKSNLVKTQLKTYILNNYFFVSSSNSSINNFFTFYMETKDIQKINTKFSFESSYQVSSSTDDLIKFNISQGTKNKIIEKYFTKIQQRYNDSFYFKLTDDIVFIEGENPLSGVKNEDDSEFKAAKSPLVGKLVLNPIRTKKEILCKKQDSRLINILDEIKISAKNSMAKSCFQPIFLPDGKKAELSPADKANNLGSIRLLLRLYAIDFNLKLLPYGNFLSFMQGNSLYEACYQLMIKDLQNLFGVTFKNKIIKLIVDEYASEQNLSEEEKIIFAAQEKNKIDAFIRYFKDENFIGVNKQIKLLVNNTINNSKFDKSIWNTEEKDLFNNSYDNLLDYEFKNIPVINVINERLPINKTSIDNNSVIILKTGATTQLKLLEEIPSENLDDYIKNKSITLFEKQITGDFREDTNLTAAFRSFFKYYVPLEEIYSLSIRNSLITLSSINSFNSSFNACKKQLKTILDIIEYANDINKNIEDDGITELFSKLKVSFQIPAFMVTALAESIDPNVAVASKISKAYEAGVAVATAAGVDIPIKKLPLFITSPLLFASFLFPLSPVGIPAILLSLKDLNIDFDSSTVTEDDLTNEGDC